MPDPLGTAAITKVVGKVLDELIETGKDLFSAQLNKFKREGVRRNLAKRAAACERVKTIWQLEKEVRIPDFYFPSRIRFNAQIQKEASNLKHFTRKGNIVIEGTIGQGKSIFLRYLCAQELRGKGTDRIPIFVELRLVESVGGLQAALLRTLDEYGFEVNDDLWNFYAVSGKFVLLLDAFDELPPECVASVLAELDHLTLKYPDLQVFVTSRPDSDIQRNRHFRTFKLAPLSSADQRPFLRKLLANDGDVKKLVGAIEASPTRVASLLTTPLMLTLVAMVYRAEKTIPPELPQFYEMLFKTLFSRHDRTKDGFIRKRVSPLTERDTQALFEAFCFMTRYHAMSTSLSDADFGRAMRDAMKYSGVQCDADAFYFDITKVACLMQREGAKTNFVHKSIQEFFAASFVRTANDDFAAKFYQSQRAKQQWYQEMSFLMQIDAYRFGKRFYIPEIQEVERYCEVDFALGTPEATEAMVLRIIGESELHVIDDDGFLESEVLYAMPPNAGPLLRGLVMRCAWATYQNIDGAQNDDRSNVLAVLSKKQDDDDEESYVAPLATFVEKFDLMDDVRDNIDNDFQVMKARFDHLSEVIKLEESKADIFEGVVARVTS